MHPWEFLRYVFDKDRNLSWPAVSHIYNLIVSLFTKTVFILKSIPKVAFESGRLDCPSVNLKSRLVFPVPLSPIITILNISDGPFVPFLEAVLDEF